MKCLFIPGIHEVCCCYCCSQRANVQWRRCEGPGRVRVSVEKWKKLRNRRREMDECQCRERSAGKAVHGNIITHYHGCLHLHVLDSYPQTWIDMHQQLLVTVLCSCCFVSSPASSFTTSLCQYNMTGQVPYSGIIFFSATASQAQLGCLPVPLSSITQPSCQLNFNVDTLNLKFA